MHPTSPVAPPAPEVTSPAAGHPTLPSAVLDLMRNAALCAGAGLEHRPAGAEPVQIALAPACERCRRTTPAIHLRCLEEIRPTLGAAGSHLCFHGQAIRAVAGGEVLGIVAARRAANFAALLEGTVRYAGRGSLGPPGPAIGKRTRDPKAPGVLDPTLRSLVAAIDAKDTYTCGHSERVHIAATALGEIIGLDAATAADLYWASLLHDVGKIGVPDQILNKPGGLTSAEYEIMKQHSARGDEVLAPITWLAEARRGVRHHHERMDGNGYPDGLAGAAIPLIARVIAVADTFDALTSRRPYRAERGPAGALAVLEAAAGAQLDPELVAAFSMHLGRILAALEAATVPAEGLRRNPGAAGNVTHRAA